MDASEKAETDCKRLDDEAKNERPRSEGELTMLRMIKLANDSA